MSVPTASLDLDALLDGFERVESPAELRERLQSGRPLTVKLGIDPTSSDLHLGFAVVLHQLQRFAEAGHHVVLIIGDFTARIGDPSGRNVTRPTLTTEEIEANMQTYRAQAGKILDLERVTIRYNSEWLGKLDFANLIRLAAMTTVAQMLERNDFSERYRSGSPIALHEFLYPIAQAYDSVAIGADVELGGIDQLFNLLLGRHYQERHGQRPQVCAMTPLLVGLDGVRKMSKSYGNYVGIAEPPDVQFGKLMSLPDAAMPEYARYAAFRPRAECEAFARALREGRLDPMEEKKRLAEEIVARYHGAEAAARAREYFERTVQRRELPDEVPEMPLGGRSRVAEVLIAAGFAQSRREAERLIAGGGVRIDGIAVSDPKARWTAVQPAVVSVGSRRFVRVIPDATSSVRGGERERQPAE